MTQTYAITAGHPSPLGATFDGAGVNFALFSQHADRVQLCLFDAHGRESRFDLPERDGHVWHGYISGLRPGQRYGYRVHGPYKPEEGHRFNPNKLLIDPYAKRLTGSPVQHDALYGYKARDPAADLSFDTRDSAPFVPRSAVVDPSFSWGADPPLRYPMTDTVIYEAHVKGLTAGRSDIPDRGTYLAMASDPILEHLNKLGVTAIELLPVHAFIDDAFLVEKRLRNYWGYMSLGFFAPEPRYMRDGDIAEFQQMVSRFHQAGIEVILDVVYNHTAESGFDGPMLSLKGFDNAGYYAFESGAHGPDYHRHANVTGCGNSVNLDHPNTLRLVLDALRYWVTEMQVDGFRFDLAVTLAREAGEFDPMSAFFKAMMADPVLARVRLIAEPWDIGPFGYRLGQFPSQWLEINDRYRDTVRAFWRGDAGKMGDFATRLVGSRDLFPKNWRSPHTSVNYLCYHDGFTLEDLVSYNQRHNQANGEDNRDGHGNNLSSNHGVEGPTLDPRINNLRQQQKRNLIATLLLSQGTPHFLAGDEMGRSQLGNNNAYCQDNQISWVNWQLRPEDERLLAFTRQMMALRAESGVFSNLQLSDDGWNGKATSCHQVNWYHPDGHQLTDQDWHAPMGQAFAMDIGMIGCTGERWYVLFNASDYDIQFRLPPPGEGMEWIQTIDTATNDGLPFLPDDIKRQVAVGRAHSLKLLERVALPAAVLASEGVVAADVVAVLPTGSQFPLAG
jgi:glycogen operon protein